MGGTSKGPGGHGPPSEIFQKPPFIKKNYVFAPQKSFENPVLCCGKLPPPTQKKKKNKKRENFRVPPGGNPDLLFNENNFSRRG